MARTYPNETPSSEAIVIYGDRGGKLELKDAIEMHLEAQPKAEELGSLISELQRQFGFEDLLPHNILAVLRDHPSTFVFRVCSGEIIVGTMQSQLEAYVQAAPKKPPASERTVHDDAFAFEKQRAPHGRYFPVTVTYVKNPHNLVLRVYDLDISVKLAELHDTMDKVYTDDLSARYSIPRTNIPVGLPCAVSLPALPQQNGNWRRAVVASAVQDDMVQVALVDCPGKLVVCRFELRVLLSEFFDLPAQNIFARLAYVRPTNRTAGWQRDATDFVISQAADKILMCSIVDAGKRPIRVLLCDTTTEEDVFLNATLVQNELALLCD